MGTLLRDRFVRLWGARRNLCHVCVSAIPKEENNERRRRMKKEGGSALRRSRGKFTTLNAFARRSEVKLKLAERNIMAKRAVLWNLLSKFQT